MSKRAPRIYHVWSPKGLPEMGPTKEVRKGGVIQG